MTEKIFYIVMLIMCSAGILINYFSSANEQKNRGTLFFTAVILAKRLVANHLVRRYIVNRIIERWKAVERDYYNHEIYDSVLLLKNLATMEHERAFSADFIYEKLMENSNRLKPVYSQMISLYRSGRDRDAFESFAEKTGSRYGKNFSFVLARLDQINPAELMEQMEVFQEMMAQQRMTDNLKKVQNSSLLTTAAAATVFFVMIIDFAVVVLFMNTLDMMKNIF